MAHSLNVKVACMGDLLLGSSIRQVSRAHGVPRSTVHRWQQEVFRDWAPQIDLGPFRFRRKRGAKKAPGTAG